MAKRKVCHYLEGIMVEYPIDGVPTEILDRASRDPMKDLVIGKLIRGKDLKIEGILYNLVGGE